MLTKIRNYFYHLDLAKTIISMEWISYFVLIFFSIVIIPMATIKSKIVFFINPGYVYGAFMIYIFLFATYNVPKYQKYRKLDHSDWRLAPTILFNGVFLRFYLNLYLKFKNSRIKILSVSLPCQTIPATPKNEIIYMAYHIENQLYSQSYSYFKLGGTSHIINYKMIANLIMELRLSENPASLVLDAIGKVKDV